MLRRITNHNSGWSDATRILSVALFLSLQIVLIFPNPVLASTNERQSEDLRATKDRLFEYFMSVVFGESEQSGDSRIIVRFRNSVRIGIAANSRRSANERLTLLEANIQKIAAISNLRLAYDQKNTNTQIFFYNSLDQLSELADSLDQGYERSVGMKKLAGQIREISDSQCFHGAAVKADGTISFVLVAVPEFGDAEWGRRCLLKAFLKGLGLSHMGPKNTYFGTDDRTHLQSLPTAREWLLLKILYDERMVPGMSSQEAGPVARSIVNELFKSN